MSLDAHKDPHASRPSEPQPEPSPNTGEVLAQRGPDRFVSDFVYNAPSIEVARTRLATALRTARPAELEPLKEAAFELCIAIDEHEKANQLYHGTWGVAIQRKQREAGKEDLTRSQVEQALRGYTFAHELEQREKNAMEHYRKALVYLQQDVFQVRPSICISGTDVQALLNDLANRRINRYAHADDRQLRFFELDRQLERIIADIPANETGKRAELQEIYLIRRLIRDADMDHLIQIEHGAIREDLMKERGSIDMVITIAGQSWGVQAKTLLQKASDTSRAIQYDVMQRAKQKASTQGTLLVEFELDRVTHEYAKVLKEDRTAISKLGKFEALSPLFDALPADGRAFLLRALHLTEADLAVERADIEKKERELEALRVARLRKQSEETERIRQLNAERVAREEAARLAEEARLADVERRRTEQAEADRRAAIEATAQRFAAQAKKIADVETGATKRAEAAKQKARAEKAAATRAANAEERAKFWHQGPIMKIAIPKHLVRLGLLAPNWPQLGIDTLDKAKQAFADRFAKTKKGKPASLNDIVNDEFIELFPTQAAFEAATNVTREDEIDGLLD